MAAKIIVPNKSFNGKRFGVQFKRGEAVVEDVEKAKKIEDFFGYEVEYDEEKAEPKPKPKQRPKKQAKTEPENKEEAEPAKEDEK